MSEEEKDPKSENRNPKNKNLTPKIGEHAGAK